MREKNLFASFYYFFGVKLFPVQNKIICLKYSAKSILVRMSKKSLSYGVIFFYLTSVYWYCCMHRIMFVKCVFPHECFIAFGTSVWLLSSVDSCMLFQFAFLGTGIGTNITLVWLLFSVDHHMSPKVRLLICCKLTLTAPVWLLS